MRQATSPSSRRPLQSQQRAVALARTAAEARSFLSPRRSAGETIGLVPTMGALHDGHLSLIAAARRQCQVVVVSIFVNPSQFDEQSDLAAYPRQEQRDLELACQAGADLVFAPPVEEIYRPGFATAVEVGGLTVKLEGAARGAGHFRGVTTVVCKLLNICRPHTAFFGAKDAQQAAVIRRMVSDLDIDSQIETMPTVREPDGLAMSSRNSRLAPEEREQALSLYRALRSAEALAAGGESSASRLLEAARATLAAAAVEPEYVALVDPGTFEEIDSLWPGHDGLMLLAARIGSTRLIDNLSLSLPARADLAQVEPNQGGASQRCVA